MKKNIHYACKKFFFFCISSYIIWYLKIKDNPHNLTTTVKSSHLVSPLLQNKIIFLISFSLPFPPPYIITGGTLSRYDAPRWTKPSLVPCIKQIVRGTLSHPGDLDEDESGTSNLPPLFSVSLKYRSNNSVRQ